MRYVTVVQRRATGDIRRAVAWIARHISTVSAARWQARILRAVESLETKPDRCPEADEEGNLGINLRCLLSGRRPHVYRILFTVDGLEVNVHRILHAFRDHIDSEDL